MKTQEQRAGPLKSHIQSDPRPMAQMKTLQFRSIAPKAPTAGSSSAVLSCQPPKVPAVGSSSAVLSCQPPKALTVGSSSAVLSCQPPPALPEPSTAVSPKSILLPAQKYALMQVAGQGGTFSLVALPQTPPQNQIQKNLKLPIPRYQPIRSKRTPETVSRTPENTSRTPEKASKSPDKASRALEKVSRMTQSATANAVKVKTESPEQSSEQIARTESTVQSKVLPDNFLAYQGTTTNKAVERSVDSLSNLSYPNRASTATLVAPLSNSTPIKAQVEHSASASSAITVLSPTIFSKAVQIIASPPKGKLPILPYAKVKNSLLSSTGVANTQATRNSASIQTKSSLKNPLDIRAKTMDNRNKNNRFGQDSDATLCKKPPPKKRGRKRKTMEDVLAFEARKKRSLSFFCRRVPEKTPPSNLSASSQDRVVDISKKYRTIRPKPVLVMESTVPQLVRLPSISASENVEREVNLRQQMSIKSLGAAQPNLVSIPTPDQQSAVKTTSDSKFMNRFPRTLHRCPTCSRCFQFKHHLQSHLNSHSNLRPYGCPVCRKAYAHSGSLSTHMKLHHAEGRPRKSLRCEFCEKAFGYVGVYFSHLREVHRVILTVEPSISQHEENTPIEGCTDSDEQASEQHVDPVELQIKCGRCQAITPTFADMKLHLLYVHGEEVQVRLKEGVVHGGREAEDELVKHAAHYWRQLNERRNLVRCGNCDEEFFSFSKLKRHLHSHHQGAPVSLKEEQDQESEDTEHTSVGTAKRVTLRTGSQFNCILCSKVLDKKQDVLEHWRGLHNCKNPDVLWEVLVLREETVCSQPKVAS